MFSKVLNERKESIGIGGERMEVLQTLLGTVQKMQINVTRN